MLLKAVGLPTDHARLGIEAELRSAEPGPNCGWSDCRCDAARPFEDVPSFLRTRHLLPRGGGQGLKVSWAGKWSLSWLKGHKNPNWEQLAERLGVDRKGSG